LNRIFLLIILTLILFNSCSTISYRSAGEIPVHFTGGQGHTHQILIEGSTDFFVWGLVPGKRYVDLDKLIASQGYVAASRIRIHEYSSFLDVTLGLLSLGLYMPKSYHIQGRGKRLED